MVSFHRSADAVALGAASVRLMSVLSLIMELILVSNNTQLDGGSYSSHNASGSTHGVNSVDAVQKYAFELASSKEPLEAVES